MVNKISNLIIQFTDIMKKIFFVVLLLMNVTGVTAQIKTLYDFKTTTIDGKPFELSTLRGKKVLIVNTASKCGFTPQYEGLQRLYEKYKGQNFVIIGFPANNFKNQEPGSNSEIKEYCSVHYGVTFPLMAKISVSGIDMDPIYKWLTSKSENGIMDAPVLWNFQKFMVDENGHLAGVAMSAEKPDSQRIINWIESKTAQKSDLGHSYFLVNPLMNIDRYFKALFTYIGEWQLSK
jgi:glutathione peroxidase